MQAASVEEVDQAAIEAVALPIEGRHPGWHVWTTGNTWWATAPGSRPWSRAREQHGCMSALNERTPELLERLIAHQESCVWCR